MLDTSNPVWETSPPPKGGRRGRKNGVIGRGKGTRKADVGNAECGRGNKKERGRLGESDRPDFRYRIRENHVIARADWQPGVGCQSSFSFVPAVLWPLWVGACKSRIAGKRFDIVFFQPLEGRGKVSLAECQIGLDGTGDPQHVRIVGFQWNHALRLGRSLWHGRVFHGPDAWAPAQMPSAQNSRDCPHNGFWIPEPEYLQRIAVHFGDRGSNDQFKRRLSKAKPFFKILRCVCFKIDKSKCHQYSAFDVRRYICILLNKIFVP